MINKLFTNLFRYKTGIIIGALVGAGMAYYTILQGVDISTLSSAGQGLIDSLGRSATATPQENAVFRLYASFMSMGAIIGGTVDALARGRRR